MKIVVACMTVVLGVGLVGCKENRQPEPYQGIVTKLVPPGPHTRPGFCAKTATLIIVRSETTQQDPFTGAELTVGNEHFVCKPGDIAARYKVGDPYP